MTKHTPTPWSVQRYGNYNGFSIWAPGAGCVAERWSPSEDKETPFEANAKFICRAVNSHDALLAALIHLRNEARGCTGLDEAELRAVLGNTNFNCLIRRIEEAEEVIKQAEAE
jgi:hypothetical protein